MSQKLKIMYFLYNPVCSQKKFPGYKVYCEVRKAEYLVYGVIGLVF